MWRGRIRLLLILVAVVCGIGLYFVQHFYLALPLDDNPSSRTITISSESPQATINPTPNDVDFEPKIGTNIAGFTEPISENICLLTSNKVTTERAAKLMQELGLKATVSVDNRDALLWFAGKGILGTLYASFYICFSIRNLSSGSHIITLNTSDSANVPYSKSWIITIQSSA